jgi:hypothetical protein
VLGIAALPLAATTNRADVIVLRGSGQIRGKVLPTSERGNRVTIVPAKGKSLLTFQKSQISKIVPEPSALDEYVVKRVAGAYSAESQYELGLWCEQHKLPDLAVHHYEAAVDADKSFAPAHQKLGHSLVGDKWLNADEVRQSQGLVQYKGRWISKEDRGRRQAHAALTSEQNALARRIQLLRQAIDVGPDDRRREAEKQLMEIRDPTAVRPLVRVLGEDTAPFRILLDHILGQIKGPEASAALVRHVLSESDADVRHATMDELHRREDPKPIIAQLTQALREKEPAVVNRAAWALGNLGAVRAVPQLVASLYTTQYQVMWGPSGGAGSTAGAVGSAVSGSGPTVPMQLAPMAFNGSSIAYLTPPAVAPGAVAFGATSTSIWPMPGMNPPFIPGLPPLGNITAGYTIGGAGGDDTGGRGPIPKLVPYTTQNVEVLAALVKLSGRDFGFDAAAWRNWLNTSFKPEPEPLRRVPEP